MVVNSINFNNKSNFASNANLKTSNHVAFKKNKNETDDFNFEKRQGEASKSKKILVGASSLLIPGAGQVINGQLAKGFIMFGSSVGAFALFKQGHIINKPILTVVGVAADIVISIYSAIDAVKNAKAHKSK